jgi:signal transduction histidine kinase
MQALQLKPLIMRREHSEFTMFWPQNEPRNFSKEARNRADAMQVDRQAEQARSEAEHLRQLASVEARRAEVLQKNAETLEHLGAIGREITACLDAGLVFQVLKRHVHHLLDVNAFIILLMADDGTALNLAFGIEDGKPQPPVRIALSRADSDAARSVRERREIMINHDFTPLKQEGNTEEGNTEESNAEESNTAIPGTKPTLSRMFAPLWLADKVIGVMTIQSVNSHAYGSREQFIFRTLCAYTAIALGNADTMLALHQAQAQLAQQEKMASLGGLVANFAHEINTPIAAVKSSNKIVSDSVRDTLSSLPQLFQILNLAEQALFMQLVCPEHKSKAVLSSRQERSMARAIQHILEAENISNAHQKASILVQLRRSEMIEPFLPLLKHAQCDAILSVARQFSMIDDSTLNIDTATNRVAGIIAALNAFSDVGQRHEKVATHLQEGIEATLMAHQNQMQNKVLVVRDYASIPALHCVPRELNQVWDNLIRNALQAMTYEGTLRIRLRQEGGEAVVEIQDTGAGIAEAIRGRIFDAFFSTKNTGEGSGLGLAIVKKVIERHRGRIEFDGVTGGGTRFTVYLPYV